MRDTPREMYSSERRPFIAAGIEFKEKFVSIPERGIQELRRANKELVEIIYGSKNVEEAQENLTNYLSKKNTEVYESKKLTPLKIRNSQKCIGVLTNILSKRNEERTSHSALTHLYKFISNKESGEISKGFIEEFFYLFRGINGRHIPIYHTKDFDERAEELDELTQVIDKYLRKYPSGLKKDVIRRRKKNRQKILDYFEGTEEDWGDWRWHMRHVIKDSDTLSDLIELTEEDVEAIDLANEHFIPFGITPYYAHLMDKKVGGKYDRAVRRQVIPPKEYVDFMKEHKEDRKEALDFMGEHFTSPIDHVTRRYPEIAILKPYDSCSQICSYCQRNWEIQDVLSKDAKVPQEELEKSIEWFRKTPSMKEVLITGGDPLVLGNKSLDRILREFDEIDHIRRIRIGTRMPVTLPYRINKGFTEMLDKYFKPGEQDVCVVTHFEHPYEITPDSRDAVQKIRRLGIGVKNQQVFTPYNSRRFESVALRKELTRIGVDPYYCFNAKGKEGTRSYRVPIARMLQERKEEARLIPGVERTDKPVFNVPKIGKTNLRGWQDFEVIMITADGSRIYEFFPWDISSETFLYKDVPIFNYLTRLERMGENIEDYKSIWQYY